MNIDSYCELLFPNRYPGIWRIPKHGRSKTVLRFTRTGPRICHAHRKAVAFM
jgi:hypothetical protein